MEINDMTALDPWAVARDQHSPVGIASQTGISPADPPKLEIAMADTHQTHSALPSVAELHTRWSALTDEIQDIQAEVDEVMMAKERLTWPYLTREECLYLPNHIEAEIGGLYRQLATGDVMMRLDYLEAQLADIKKDPEKFAPAQRKAREAYAEREREFMAKADRLGLTPKIARKRSAEAELAEVEDAMWDTRLRSVRDVAALLDYVLENADDMPIADHLERDWPYLCLLTRRLHELVPDFEFSWLRRLCMPDHDVMAELFGSDTAATAE